MGAEILQYSEHHDTFLLSEEQTAVLTEKIYSASFKKKRGSENCYSIVKQENKYVLNSSYFIGLDWVVPDKLGILLTPKLNTRQSEVDFSKILLHSLKYPEVIPHLEDLLVIKWKEPWIDIPQKQDVLTPFLIAEFLGLLKNIVRKGLKRTYYKKVENLRSKVKGKILTNQTVRVNLMQNKPLNTYCSYDEFGLDNLENRLLKKVLVFIKPHLHNNPLLAKNKSIIQVLNYVLPAFSSVSKQISTNEIKHIKSNPFYKDYQKALQIGQLILKRLSYNISKNTSGNITSPPFWIDMSKLFEIYTLGLLKDRFQNKVRYQYKTYGNELDYILKSDEYKMVIDAKYKTLYKNNLDSKDMRQVSGYSRLKKVYTYLEKNYPESIDALIIYPDQDKGCENLQEIDLKNQSIKQYFGIFKLAIKLPLLQRET